jgi:hypothetical protein
MVKVGMVIDPGRQGANRKLMETGSIGEEWT